MKKSTCLLLTLLGFFLIAPLAGAYEAPSDATLDKVLANPKLLTTVLDDATGKEAAELLNRLIGRIQAASSIGKGQKDYLIAFFTARVTFLLNQTEAIAFANEIATLVPAEGLAVVFSGMRIGGGGSSDFMTNLRTLAGENADLRTAIDTPTITLTDPVYKQLLVALGSVQTLPPTATDSVPPAGDDPQGGGGDQGGGGTGGGTPPPTIPPGYAGQG